ncbi:hypothetical protein DFJ77DRAFT_437340 [Powellomyces hirtus]|nr:hypothetical protein DFJ77DRAFT_437340 [Powellomyces hirtus]
MSPTRKGWSLRSGVPGAASSVRPMPWTYSLATVAPAGWRRGAGPELGIVKWRAGGCGRDRGPAQLATAPALRRSDVFFDLAGQISLDDMHHVGNVRPYCATSVARAFRVLWWLGEDRPCAGGDGVDGGSCSAFRWPCQADRTAPPRRSASGWGAGEGGELELRQVCYSFRATKKEPPTPLLLNQHVYRCSALLFR